MDGGTYYRLLISATSEDEADQILDLLTQKKFVAGGLISSGKSRYWWNKEIVEKVYFNISAFCPALKKDEIIRVVEEIHSDETPIIAFFKIEFGNSSFLKWIDDSCR